MDFRLDLFSKYDIIVGNKIEYIRNFAKEVERMKKLCIFLCLLLPLMMFVACNNQQVPENTDPPSTDRVGIAINAGTSLTIGVGETKQLSAINLKNDSVTTAVHWESDNASVVSVDFNGMITGIADGTANITVTSADGKYKATCAVTVSSVLLGLSLETSTLEMEKGSQATLKVIFSPENVTDVTLNWVTGDPKIVTVSNGVVTAVGNGTTSIIVSDAEGNHASVCTVTVTTTVTDVELDEHMVMLNKGSTQKLTATLLPEGASDLTITWTSSNPAIATVSNDGTVTAVAGGAAIITATSGNGKTDTCNIVVTSPVEGVTLDLTDLVLNVGQVQHLIATILPADANNQEMVWNSSDLSVVTVDGSGNVNALHTGTAVITVTTVDGYFTASCNVTVKNLVTEIVFENEGCDLEQGKTLQLIPSFVPVDADAPILTWVSSNPEIALVDENGNVKAVGLGDATITVTTENGVTASYNIHVIELEILIEKIVVESIFTVKVANSFKLAVSLIPINTTEGYTITSGDSSIVRVLPDGTLVPLKAGGTIITITSKSGNVSAKCGVYVEELTDEELKQYQNEYKEKESQLKQENIDAINSISKKWDTQIDATTKQLASHIITTESAYNSEYSRLKKELDEAESKLSEALNGGNQTLIDAYTIIRDEAKRELSELENNWLLYKLTSAKLSNLETSKKNELASENSRYEAALNALRDEYSFLDFSAIPEDPSETEPPVQTDEPVITEDSEDPEDTEIA